MAENECGSAFLNMSHRLNDLRDYLIQSGGIDLNADITNKDGDAAGIQRMEGFELLRVRRIRGKEWNRHRNNGNNVREK